MEIEERGKGLKGAKGEYILVVRPILHCPEIDSYDEISLEQIVGKYGDEEALQIGDRIVYKV